MKKSHQEGYDIGYGEVLKSVLENKEFTLNKLSMVLNISEKEINRLVKTFNKHEKQRLEYLSSENYSKPGISMYDVMEEIKRRDILQGKNKACDVLYKITKK